MHKRIFDTHNGYTLGLIRFCALNQHFDEKNVFNWKYAIKLRNTILLAKNEKQMENTEKSCFCPNFGVSQQTWMCLWALL